MHIEEFEQIYWTFLSNWKGSHLRSDSNRKIFGSVWRKRWHFLYRIGQFRSAYCTNFIENFAERAQSKFDLTSIKPTALPLVTNESKSNVCIFGKIKTKSESLLHPFVDISAWLRWVLASCEYANVWSCICHHVQLVLAELVVLVWKSVWC